MAKSAASSGAWWLLLACGFLFASAGLARAQVAGEAAAADESAAVKRAERVALIAPRTLRPASEYHVLVSLSRSQVPATYDIQITGGRDSNREHSDAKSVLVNPDEVQLVKFNIGDWPSAEYTLSLNALAVDRSWNFSQESTLNYHSKSLSVFVQSDKAIYKPGDLVSFRGLFVNQDLNAVDINDGSITVSVADSRRNLVKEWRNQSNFNGLLSLNYQLSEDPLLGDWHIKFETASTEVFKEFQVAEYILPTFNVIVELPKYASINDSELVATVRAVYTYGKPVSGHVVLTVQPMTKLYFLEPQPMRQVQYRAQLSNGSAEFVVNLRKEFSDLEDFHERSVEFFALVEEDQTGRRYNGSGLLKVFNRDVKLELVNTNRPYKPGLEHALLLKLAYQDDTPVEDQGPEVELELSMYDAESFRERAKLRPEGGLVEYKFKVPRLVKFKGSEEPMSPSQVTVRAKYRGHDYFIEDVMPFRSESNQYMSIRVAADRSELERLPRAVRLRGPSAAGKRHGGAGSRPAMPAFSVNSEARLQVEATQPMQQVTCQGLARGDIVFALNRDAKNSSSFEFSVKIDHRMLPTLRVICFFVEESLKELVADSLALQVRGLSRNFVRLDANKAEFKPGQAVDISVKSKPNSLVGLLAVDESVLLLKSGNDLSEAQVNEELRSYLSWESGAASDWGPYDARALLDSSDVVLLSNNYLRLHAWHLRFKEFLGAIPLSAMVPQNSPPMIELIRAEPSRLVLASQGDASRRLGDEPAPAIRSFFPETWIWANVSTGPDGQASLLTRAPDTITSWSVSAFSLSKSHGLALSSSALRLRVFRPFFVRPNLPYSVISGEVVTVQATVFNYLEQPVKAWVELDKGRLDEYDFVEASNSVEPETRLDASKETRQVEIPAQDSVSVSYLITPKRVGHIALQLVARTASAQDTVVKRLLVKPMGQAQHLNKAHLLSLLTEAGAGSFRANVSVRVPNNAIPGSTKVSVSAIGDVLGPGLANPDSMLRIPHGCGEQNMVDFVPNVVVLRYLEKSGRARPALTRKALKNIETGYQRQLNYKRSDGSFSAFGERDQNGSVWLTAYVLKSFQQARGLLSMDEGVLRRAAGFIARHAQPDGSIAEVGMLHDRQLSSGAAGQANSYLTAYCMIALLQGPVAPAAAAQDGEAPVAGGNLSQVLERGLAHLESRLDEAASRADSPYELAIIAYALLLADRPKSAERAYEALWARATQQADAVWWERAQPEADARPAGDSAGQLRSSTVPPLKPSLVARGEPQSEHQFLPDTLAVEMSALALLSTVRRRELERALPVVRWLVEQQNSKGGYASTQDTVLAIEALAAYAAAVAANSSTNSSLRVQVSHGLRADGLASGQPQSIEIGAENALVRHELALPDDAAWVALEASGRGSGVLQVSWQYNLMVSAERPAFYLNPILDKSSTVNYLQLSVCTFYKKGESNMALLEVELPSGYAADVEAFSSIMRNPRIKRVDGAESNSKVLIYIDKVASDEICLTVPAHRTGKVGNNKPVPVSIYDYYNRQKTARIFYKPIAATSCDICEKDSCSSQCERPKRAVSEEER